MRLLGLALIVLLAACGDDDGSGPDEEQYEGTWTGGYTNSATPGVEFEAELELTQDADDISGTLTTNSGRSATVSGSVSGDQLDATFTFTDGCAGTASTTADLVDETVPPSLEGTYAANDCAGETTGAYSLVKE